MAATTSGHSQLHQHRGMRCCSGDLQVDLWHIQHPIEGYTKEFVEGLCEAKDRGMVCAAGRLGTIPIIDVGICVS